MTTVQSSRPSLTSNDSAVLQALFDAESSPSSGVSIDPSLSALPAHLNISPAEYEPLKEQELTIVRTLQSSSTTRDTIQSAIDAFDTLINEHPSFPSAYVNRAQALRMLIDKAPSTASDSTQTNDNTLFNPANTTTVSTLFTDLGQAISLATPRSPADPVSPVQARILADAHTHRGYLLLKAAKERKTVLDGNGEAQGGPEKLRAMTADQLEEMASRDFFFGGRYGSQVAQQMAVQTNPYAKMCGAIVKEAMRKEMES